jgi:LysM repeat protein
MANNYFVYQGMRGKPRLFMKQGDQFFRVKDDGTLAKSPTGGLIAANLRNPKSDLRRPATAADLKSFGVLPEAKAADPRKDPGKDTPGKKPAPATSGSVKVKSGDTLSQIAKAKGTTIKAIMAANPSIKNANMIRVGQTIKIPADAPKSKDPYEGQTKESMAAMAKGTKKKSRTERTKEASDKIISILKDPKYKKKESGQATMAKGGMANGKPHMYLNKGAFVKDNLNPGLRALSKTRPDVVKKILGK